MIMRKPSAIPIDFSTFPRIKLSLVPKWIESGCQWRGSKRCQECHDDEYGKGPSAQNLCGEANVLRLVKFDVGGG